MPDRLGVPSLVVNGIELQAGADDPIGVLSNISITWGNDSVLADPKPATLTGTIVYRGAVDTIILGQGTLVEIWQDVDGEYRCPFSGRIRSMTAELDSKQRLRINFTATDLLADLQNTYISTDWHSDDNDQADMPIIDHLVDELTERGWEITGLDQMPAPLGPSAATFYSSIKLTTLLRRYLAQWGPRATFWDSSYTHQQSGTLRRRLSFGHLDDTTLGFVLTAGNLDGIWTTWTTGYDDPERTVFFPASEVLQDISWQSTPDNLITAARIAFQRTRSEDQDGVPTYVTSLDEVNTSRGSSWTDQYGVRAVEVETMTFVPASDGTYVTSIYRDIGQKWMVYNSDEWRPETVTLHTVASLGTHELSNLIGKETRPRMFIGIRPVLINTPRGMIEGLYGIATGGTMTWNHDRHQWDMTFNLSDTTPIESIPWTFEDIANHSRPGISDAPAHLAGETRFAEFNTIIEIP